VCGGVDGRRRGGDGSRVPNDTAENSEIDLVNDSAETLEIAKPEESAEESAAVCRLPSAVYPSLNNP